ncbi:MAG: hypothetical protein J6K25_08530 [Thermoguttaceae bacterium]|nr:hypothetical protein [Thermoguttaceae bacterium]
MAGYFIEGFIEAFEGLIESLEEMNDELAPRYREALDEWAEETGKLAVQHLSRPRWLLSRSIGDKVKDYRKDRKLWAMAGFQFQHNLGRSKNPRDPGNYGQYHEGGWRPGKYRVSAPDHFLRRAKAETIWPLLQKIERINGDMVAQIMAEKRRRAAAAKELREIEKRARRRG